MVDVDIDKMIQFLEDMDVKITEREVKARVDIRKCRTEQLFDLVAQTAMYRGFTGMATEFEPDNGKLLDYNHRSREAFITAEELTKEFEDNCICKECITQTKRETAAGTFG